MALVDIVRRRMQETLGGEEAPAEWREIHQQVINGTHPQIPSYGHGQDSHLDYYGRFDGIEKGRMIIPDGEFEHSTHISHPSGGEFVYIDEGVHPRSD